jgi:hypothetical protein
MRELSSILPEERLCVNGSHENEVGGIRTKKTARTKHIDIKLIHQKRALEVPDFLISQAEILNHKDAN